MTELESQYQMIHQETEEEAMQSGEGIESIVCKNLYDHIFAVQSEYDRNQKIELQIKLHQAIVKPEHLELPSKRVKPDTLKFAVGRLS